MQLLPEGILLAINLDFKKEIKESEIADSIHRPETLISKDFIK